MAVGRPRQFDPDEVLDTAMRLFWRHGYEAVGIADLTAATGVNRRSLYATFGSKEQLFRRAVQRYAAGPAGYVDEALTAPTAREVAHALLHGAATATTRPDCPRGCLIVQGAVATTAATAPVHEELVRYREDLVRRLADRFAAARDAGEIPGADPMVLARWITAVGHGIAVAANGGVESADLHALADQALTGWPARDQTTGVS